MSRALWVQITCNGEDHGVAPLRKGDQGWMFCDGCYSTFDHFYKKAGPYPDDEEAPPGYDEFEQALLLNCDRLNGGESVWLTVMGDNFELEGVECDCYGNPIEREP